MQRDFLSEIPERVIIADGAIGTMLAARGLHVGSVPAPALNLLRPTFVEQLHEEYIEAGAELIETNTFGANRILLEQAQLGDKLREINIEGARLAKQAAAERAWVAGSIAPIGPRAQKMAPEEVSEIYREQTQALIEGGVDLIVVETLSEIDDARTAIAAVRSVSKDIPLMVQMAFTLTGHSTSGVSPTRMIQELKNEPVDIFGHNCGGGESAALAAAQELTGLTDKPLSIFFEPWPG